MQMPVPDAAVLQGRAAILTRLAKVLPADALISDPHETRAYECDALTAYRCAPLAVVLPRTTAEVSAVLAECHAMGARGTGGGDFVGRRIVADGGCRVRGVERMTAVGSPTPHRACMCRPGHQSPCPAL